MALDSMGAALNLVQWQAFVVSYSWFLVVAFVAFCVEYSMWTIANNGCGKAQQNRAFVAKLTSWLRND
eukprot:3073653-Amphidinium_carterae.1